MSETLLFWAVLSCLLFIDNLVLLPGDADYLRFNGSGRWRYEPGLRLQVRQRDLILLNPLDPFDRMAQTNSAIGKLTPQLLRVSRQRVRSTLRHINLLSLIGSGYLLALAGLAGASIWLYFGDVLLTLLLVHLAIWIAAVAVLFNNRQALCLSRFRAFSLSLEAFLVPSYLVNLGKRVWYRQTLDLPALTVGLRQLKRMPIDSARELYAMQISRRLDELAVDLNIDNDPPLPLDKNDTMVPSAAVVQKIAKTATSSNEAQSEELRDWFKEARQCLTILVQVAGS